MGSMESTASEKSSNILVVYYSRTGSTRKVAEYITKQLGADMEEIIDMRKRSGAGGFVLGGRDAIRRKETEISEIKKGDVYSSFSIILLNGSKIEVRDYDLDKASEVFLNECFPNRRIHNPIPFLTGKGIIDAQIGPFRLPLQQLHKHKVKEIRFKLLDKEEWLRTKRFLSLLSQAKYHYLERNLNETVKKITEAISICK